jgi:predicted nuclease of restriction endonuclease-like (RecB) superfamily
LRICSRASKRGYHGDRPYEIRAQHNQYQPQAEELENFAEIAELIASSRDRVIQSINTGIIDLYWTIGERISQKIAAAEWGDGVVDQLATYLARSQPGMRGFTRANLFRMRQFYETYRSEEKVAPLARQLPWTHNMVILGQSKRPEEREFYLRTAIHERWSRRELERQMDAALFERVVVSPVKVSPAARQNGSSDRKHLQRRLHAGVS